MALHPGGKEAAIYGVVVYDESLFGLWEGVMGGVDLDGGWWRLGLYDGGGEGFEGWLGFCEDGEGWRWVEADARCEFC